MSDTPNSTPPEANGPSLTSRLGAWWKSRPHRYINRILVFIIVITLFRLWFTGEIDLIEDEAYYWLWSKNLDICYYSKGPGVAWTIAAGTFLFGDTESGIRFFSVLLAAGTGLGIFYLSRRLFSARTGFYAVLLGAVTPLFAVGSVLMTIDPLSIFFWVWAAYTFWRARSSGHPGWWIGTGLLIGAGMLCKYTNGAQIICFGLFCLLSSADRIHLRRPYFYLMALASILCLTPTLIWNARYDWITIQHLLERGKIQSDDPFQIRTGELIQFIQEQALAYSPLIFIAGLAALGWAAWRYLPSHGPGVRAFRLEWIFLLCLAAPLFLFYLGLSINEAGEANWTSPCYPAVFIALSALWTRHHPPQWVRAALKSAFFLALLMTLLLHASAFVDVTRWGLPDPLRRVKGHRHLGLEIAKVQEASGANFIVAKRYQTASLLSFYMPGHPVIYVPYSENIVHQFSFWPSYNEMPTYRNSALYVSKDRDLPDDRFQSQFRSVEFLKRVNTQHHGRLVRPYFTFFCDTFIGIDPEPPPSD